MERTGMRRVSSAGFRLQARTTAVRPKSAHPRTERSPSAREEGASPGTGQDDPVKQDLKWREQVLSERRLVKEWEKNWDFLKKYNQLGELKEEAPLPSHVPIFSKLVPQTNNQMFGSRLSSPAGKELLRMERLLFCNHQRCKLNPEMLSD